MGTYLEDYLESVKNLPPELHRNFALMRELDTRSQDLIEKLEVSTKKYLTHARKAHKDKTPTDEAQLTDIRNDQKQVLELGDEKVALAEQTYDLVDQHIRNLDRDLRIFEAELNKNAPPDQPIVSAKDDTKKESKKRKVEETVVKQSKAQKVSNSTPQRGSTKANTAAGAMGSAGALHRSGVYPLEAPLEAPIDPNEPKYCVCQRVSFGEMIGCDGDECRYQWFHFDCVGLSLNNPPKGKWYCSDCAPHYKKK